MDSHSGCHCCPSGPCSWGVHSVTLECRRTPACEHTTQSSPQLEINRGYPATNTAGSLFPAQKPNMLFPGTGRGSRAGGGWGGAKWQNLGVSVPCPMPVASDPLCMRTTLHPPRREALRTTCLQVTKLRH